MILTFKQFTEAKQSTKDIADAKSVLRSPVSDKIRDRSHIESKLDSFSREHQTEKLPLDKIHISHDHGRRIKKTKHLNTPVIAMKKGNGEYHILDGQHRVLSHREAGHTHIDASVVKPKWVATSKTTHHSTGELE